MNSIVYTFFETGVEIIETQTLISSQTSSQQATSKSKKKTLSYKCKICSKLIKSQVGVNSNLNTHISTRNHDAQKKELDEWCLKNKGKKQSLLTETLLIQANKRARLLEYN